MKRKYISALMILLATMNGSALLHAAVSEAPATTTKETIIKFVPQGWNPDQWTPVRTPNQERAVDLLQKTDSVGTTVESFDKTDYHKQKDNALLLYDTGKPEGEVVLTFGLGPGFNKHSSPGICLSPVVKEGVLQSGIGVFVGTYAVVAWYAYADGDTINYIQLGQLARWTDPALRHTLRCRFSKKQRSIGIKLDDSDTLVFKFIGNQKLSYINHEINSSVALWGCHGVTDFYEMKVGEGTMPFEVRK